MSPKVLVPVSKGFEEIEAITIVDVLRRASIQVIVAGVTPGIIRGRSQIGIEPDCSLDDALLEAPFDMVVLPGGLPNAYTLRDDKRVIDILKTTNAQGSWVAAICAAPAALTAAGLLSARKATIYPGNEADLPPGSHVAQNVVVSDGVITSRGPGTALEFSLALVKLLCGKVISEKVSSALLA